MKSQISQVARNCRIREWASMVQECRNRPNGMSVDEWCQVSDSTLWWVLTAFYFRCIHLPERAGTELIADFEWNDHTLL